MRHLVAAFLTVTLLALPARAEMTWLPKWHMTGEDACYDLEGAKKLLEGDLKLVSCDRKEKEYKLLVDELKLTIQSKDAALVASKKSVELLQENNATLSTQQRTCITDLGTCQAKQPMATYWWLVISVTALVVGVGAGIALDRGVFLK
jgi:hypothetical protein